MNRHTAAAAAAAVDESTLDKHNSMEKRMGKTQTEAFIVKSNSMLVYRQRVSVGTDQSTTCETSVFNVL